MKKKMKQKPTPKRKPRVFAHREAVASTVEPLVVTVEEARRLLRLGQTYIYELIGTGELPSRKIGRRRLIPLDDLKRFVEAKSKTKADSPT